MVQNKKLKETRSSAHYDDENVLSMYLREINRIRDSCSRRRRKGKRDIGQKQSQICRKCSEKIPKPGIASC